MKETRQLRYFVAVAEELHFGRAADRLGVAQPSLSRAVRGLEGVLGTQLFERSTRHVGLTSAGQSLLIDARAALDAVSSAGRRAVRAGLARPSLAIASKPDGDAGVLCEVLAALQREAPGVEAELLFAAAGDQAATMLRDGRADVALVPAPFDERGLDWKCSPPFYRGRDPDSLAQAAPSRSRPARAARRGPGPGAAAGRAGPGGGVPTRLDRGRTIDPSSERWL